MTQVTIEVPKQFTDLSAAEQESLIRAGMREAIQSRIRELMGELRDADEHIREFEEKYGASLADFERDILPTVDTFEGHEAYNDWSYWVGVRAEKSRLLTNMQS